MAPLTMAIAYVRWLYVLWLYLLWRIVWWQGPALIFGFFLGSATITRLVASPVAALTARVQAAERDL